MRFLRFIAPSLIRWVYWIIPLRSVRHMARQGVTPFEQGLNSV